MTIFLFVFGPIVDERQLVETIFTILIVALIALLCGPFSLQRLMNFVTQRLMSFSQIGGRRVRVQYIPMNDAHTIS